VSINVEQGRGPASPVRRRLLVAGSGVVVAAVAGGVWVGSRLDGREAWIESVLRTNLPGIKLDPASLAKFVKEFAQHREFNDDRSNIAVMMDQVAPALTRKVEKADRRVDRMERLVVTEYLMGSNFFRVPDPQQETIFYISSVGAACGNPFAVFRDV
jgi:hypothetical protein